MTYSERRSRGEDDEREREGVGVKAEKKNLRNSDVREME